MELDHKYSDIAGTNFGWSYCWVILVTNYPPMLIHFFFLPKETLLLFKQLLKISPRNISVLKCQNRKQNVRYHDIFPLMQLSVEIQKFQGNCDPKREYVQCLVSSKGRWCHPPGSPHSTYCRRSNERGHLWAMFGTHKTVQYTTSYTCTNVTV